MSDKLKRFKTYRHEYHRDRRRNDKWRGQIEARLEADRIDQETKVSVSATY